MKKLVLTFSLLAVTALLVAQDFSSAGLLWSKDCTTGKPFKQKRVYSLGSPITKAKIAIATASPPTATDEIIELTIPNGEFLIIERVDIPTKVLLRGSGSTEIRIGTDPNAGFKLVGPRSGLENMNITNFTEIYCCYGAGSGRYSILISGDSCWVKGIRSYYGGTNGHIQITGNNNEVSGCYITENRCASNLGGGRAYGINISTANQNVVSHNVLSRLRHHILLNGTSENNVVAYNKTSDTVFENWAGAADCDICYSNRIYISPYVSYWCWQYQIAGDLFANPGQIEFHGGASDVDLTQLGPKSNLVEGNCVTGNIKYYQGNKGNNQGGDVIRFNKRNGNLIGIFDVLNFTDPISTPSFSASCSNTYYPQKPKWWPSWSSFPCGDLCVEDMFGVDCEFRTREPTMRTFGRICGDLFNFNNETQMFEPAGTSPGSISITPEGGTPPYNLNISGPNIATISGTISESEFIADGFFAGTYTVTLTDANNQPQPALTSVIEISCEPRFFRDGMEVLYLKANNGNDKPVSTINNEKINLEIDDDTGSETVIAQDLNKDKADLKLVARANSGIAINNAELNKGKRFNSQFKSAPLNLITYPNPTSDQMNIRYQIEESDIISIKLVNNIGQVVRLIEDQVNRPSGIHEVSFTRGELSSGIYFGVLTSKNHKYTFKVVLQ